MNIAKLSTHDSVISPGVRYTVRRLGMAARSRRDLKMLDALSRQADLRAIGESLTEDGPDTIRRVRDGKQAEFERSSLELANLQFSEIIPAYLRAGLVKVEGFVVDGDAADPETFIEEADRDLLIEAQILCAQASDLTDEERKNLPSRTTSPEPEPVDATNTTVESAGTSDTTSSASA